VEGEQPHSRSGPSSAQRDHSQQRRTRPLGRQEMLLVAGMVGVRIVVRVAVLHSAAAKQYDKAIAFDAARYHQIAHSTGTPYRDFEVEFPPVSLALIDAAATNSLRGTEVNLAWSQLVLDLLTAGALLFGWGSGAALAYLLLGTPLLLFIYFRIDLLSVMLAAWAAALLRRRHDRIGGGLLAASVLAKIWPLVLAPVLLAQASRRARIWFGAFLVGGTAAWISWGGPSAVRQVVTFRGARGWQGESLVGSILRIDSRNVPVFEAGSLRLGHVPFWARIGLIALLIAAVALVAVLTRKTSVEAAGLPSVTVVSCLLFLSPTLSAQYASWLLPWAAVARNERYAERILLVLMLLTTASIFEFEGNLVVLIVRNVLLVVVAGFGLARLVRLVRAGRQDAAAQSIASATQ
jgi:hypothetical protein